jgi:CBS-domain-containing membrane protein
MTTTLETATEATTSTSAALTAADLMSPVDNVITDDATLSEVVRRFQEGRGRHLIVLDQQGNYAGVIGPRHVAQAHRFDPRRDDEIPAAELGAAPWIALAAADTLQTCARMLVEYDLDAIPVLDARHRAVGVVSVHDLVRAIADAAAEPLPRLED